MFLRSIMFTLNRDHVVGMPQPVHRWLGKPVEGVIRWFPLKFMNNGMSLSGSASASGPKTQKRRLDRPRGRIGA